MSTCIVRRRRLGRTSCRGISEKSRTGITAALYDRGIPEADLYIRWGCTANIPGRNVVNTASAIHQVNDKAAFRMLLNEHELCPHTCNTLEQAREEFEVDEEGEDILAAHGAGDGGLIVRPARHAQGRNLHVCYSFRDVVAHCTRYGEGNYYISELIPKVAEYRIAVVQGRVAWVARKTPGNPEDVAWNVARGGRFDNVRWDHWPLKAVRYAVEAFNLSELDFGGVDVMVDAEGNPYVIEINSAPSLTSDYRQTCMAKCFDWIVQHGKERIPLVNEKGGYRKFIHPAICERAQLT